MRPEQRTDLNQRQQEFYDNKKKNLATRIWSYFRNGVLNRIKKDIGIEGDIYDLHKCWFGDLSNKKVLDLGCYEGNSLSMYLAQKSRSYLGIDLSGKGIEKLSRRLQNIPGAKAEVIDFLSEDFRDHDFDLIYAYGVLHHFRDVDELIEKLEEKLAEGGTIISHDPLQTSFPVKIIRKMYRPFQTDKDWEWPFSKKTYYKFAEAFVVKERRGVLGKSKYVPILNLLPGSQQNKMRKAAVWHRRDWELSAVDDDHMFRCMHLSMFLQKK